MQRDFEVQSVVTSVSARTLRMDKPWGEEPRIRGTPQQCVCRVEDLVDTYVVTDDCHPGDGVSIFSDLVGETCEDLQWNGGSPVSSWLVGMDYLGPPPFFWQIGYDDDGEIKVLFKTSNDRPGGTDCNPVGVYEGDGCTAFVDYA